jgi:pyridoxamine 5'-phosphate oxidase
MIKESETGTGEQEPDKREGTNPKSGNLSPHSLFGEALEKLRIRLLNVSDTPEMLLATADTSGNPALQNISIYDIDDFGIQFFTNGRSRRAIHLRENQHAALSFWLPATNELLLVEGEVEVLDRAFLKKWWESRSREEQLLAWASNQSAPLDSLATLEQRIAQCRMQFVDGAMPPPPHWVGFRLVPNRFEFSRPLQRHITERLCYSNTHSGWTRTLLNP